MIALINGRTGSSDVKRQLDTNSKDTVTSVHGSALSLSERHTVQLQTDTDPL